MYSEERLFSSGGAEKWRYYVISERVYSADLCRWVHTYGLLAAEKRERGWVLIDLLHDAAVNAAEARHMAELFTKHQLSPVHLKEAIQDIMP
jgi:L-rhamnose isomerase